MDYEQKYKTSLDKAKGHYNACKHAGNESTAKILESIFPELRESEDERIRKALIPVVDRLLGTINFPFTEEQVLNWFEKQKERKPNIGLIQRSWYMEGYTDGEFKRESRWNLKAGKGGPKYEKNEKYGQPLEQKPAEWDDYTKTNLDRAIQIIKNAKGNLQGYQTDDGIYECDKAIEALEHFLYRGLEIEQPAEWSEEDEKMNKEIRLYLKQDRTDFPGRAERINKMIEWLINICPNSQWKPSEEQMEALEETINQDCVVCNGDRKWIKPNLESLYEQLKKMKAPKGVPPIESIQK